MASLPSPTYQHLTTKDFESIYEPAEDTFLIMDALEKDCEMIKTLRPLICLEIGPGSGVLITFLAKMVGSGSFYMASDINPLAANATRKTGIENKVSIECSTDSLISCFEKRLNGKADIILFNPPYVVTPSDEIKGNDLSASWAGGINGREVTDKILPLIPKVLSEDGLFYLLLIEENKPDEIIRSMKLSGFYHSIVLRRKAGPERLLVIRFSRSEVT